MKVMRRLEEEEKPCFGCEYLRINFLFVFKVIKNPVRFPPRVICISNYN